MNSKGFSATFSVAQSPKAVFEAISNPRGWWSEAIKGDTDKLGAVFYHQYQDTHRCTLNITELVPGKKIVWHVLQNYFDFVNDEREWTGTDVVFEIERKDGKTEVRFTHVGLLPEQECYDVCSDGWKTLIEGSLRALITAGKGNPDL
jgi:uncharacterized protein YndB with AHSA1/START domain